MQIRKKINEAPRKSEVYTLSECIEELLKYYRLKSKFNQLDIVYFWEKIMGKTIAGRTEKIFIKEKILYVKLSSAPLKHQLLSSKSKVKELVNKELGENAIEEVNFL